MYRIFFRQLARSEKSTGVSRLISSFFSSDVLPFSWNCISSKVFIPSVRSGGPPESGDKIRISAKYLYDEGPQVIAATSNYKKGFLGIPVADWSGAWIFSEININTNTTDHDWYNFSSDERRYVIAHEIGHSIGIDHQLQSCTSEAIMKNGMRWSPPFTTPRLHDKNTLIAKYGN